MCKQGIAAIQDVGYSVSLMLPQGDFRVHAGEDDMLSVVFPWAQRIEPLIVAINQVPPPVRVFPYPVPKGVLDGLLLLLCKGGFLAVEHTALSAVRVLHGVIYPHIPRFSVSSRIR